MMHYLMLFAIVALGSWDIVAVATQAVAAELTFRMKDGDKLVGEFQDAQISIKAAFGVVTIPVSDIVSYADGEARLRDGSVVKGEIISPALTIRTKYGVLSVVPNDVMAFGVEKVPSTAVLKEATVSKVEPPTEIKPPEVKTRPSHTTVQFVNESKRKLTLQVSGSEYDIGSKTSLVLEPQRSGHLRLSVGQHRVRVEVVTNLGPLVFSKGGFEKSVDIEPDAVIRFTDRDFR